ncbi:flagellar basal body-associated FliL family protein [Alkalimarinus alittae]|uniref:Flagellar protein FliL n=1 Tax=Alkalimarinus alittae TaxID=2961619 RepID=A0ABY6N332_9ALTE|nr:flagellar basal body-associated FliL family protein [Alkalimarinus alittae]UZE96522.1 flagellar basal body-associated protein FliL [Alkalimarinus alittae]
MTQFQLKRSLLAQPMKALLLAFSFIAFLMASGHSVAEAEEGDAKKIDVQYVDLKPAFVANFGGATPKLKFVKTDMSVRTHSVEDAKLIRQHMPLIRNEVVLLLSAQTEDDISTMEGQEKLRLALLDKIKSVLKEETGSPTAEDLLFTSFVLQR